MKLINNKDEWEKFRRNTSKNPSEYPILAWYEEGGGGLVGEYLYSRFREVSKNISNNWIEGFKEGLKYN